MNFIDRNGRIFGKINVIDFLILSILLIALPLFLYVYSIFGKAPTRIPQQWVKVEAVAFTFDKITDLLKPGDFSVDEYGSKDGRLLRIIEKRSTLGEKIEASRFKNMLSSKSAISTVSLFLEPVLVEMELLCVKDSKSGQWYYRRKQLLINVGDESHIFVTDKYIFTFYIIKII